MVKILVIQNKRIGDVLIASTIATNVKKHRPDAHISYLVYDYTAGVIENHPHIDRVVTVNAKELKKIGELCRVIAAIRREKYDIVFDPYAKIQSRIICLFSGVKKRIGFIR
ncbi:MAG: glycosyltransferase family 9 protein, partial [Marinirhabdus sp.]